MKKRVFALLLTAVLMAAIVPVPAAAFLDMVFSFHI